MALPKVFLGALCALLLSAQLAPAGSDAPGATCVFGMPESGYAVRKDNTGFITEVLRAAFSQAGYDLVHRDIPYPRARGELADGRIQCTLSAKGATDSGVAARCVIAACDLSVAYLASDAYTGLEDLADQKVAHLFGFDFQMLLPVRIRPEPTYDRTLAIQMLERGRVRFVIGEDTMIREAIHQAGLSVAEFGITRFMSLDVVPIFTPNTEGFRLRDIFDRRMSEMAASGELTAIFRKYGLPEDRIRHIIEADRR